MSRKDPIAYLPRIRDYYQALGFGAPYVWARFDSVPFVSLKVPLDEAQIALVTTAAPYQPDKGDQGPGAPYNAAAKFYKVYSGASDSVPDLRISHLAIPTRLSCAEITTQPDSASGLLAAV